MKNKLLLASVAISGLMSAQDNLPYVDEISAVQAENGIKFVITLQDNEYYDPSEINCIGDFNPSVKRDTFIVSSKYPACHLIDETQWEEGDALIEGTEVPEWQK